MTKTANSYAPARFDPVTHARARSAADPVFKQAFADSEEEFAALDALLAARQRAGLSQEQVARRMGVKQSALARVESSLRGTQARPFVAQSTELKPSLLKYSL